MTNSGKVDGHCLVAMYSGVREAHSELGGFSNSTEQTNFWGGHALADELVSFNMVVEK
jgi:hypothetical protein